MANPAVDDIYRALINEFSDDAELTPTDERAIRRALGDAFELGTLNRAEVPAARIERTAFGQPADPSKRQGILAQITHVVTAEQFATHGENALLAWIRQAMREAAQMGANPANDFTVQVCGMPDGSVLVAAEGGVG